MEDIKYTSGYIASLIQKNNKEEAEAVQHYTELINYIDNSDLADEDKAYLKSQVKEIIRDELDHSARLSRIYEQLTGLTPKE